MVFISIDYSYEDIKRLCVYRRGYRIAVYRSIDDRFLLRNRKGDKRCSKKQTDLCCAYSACTTALPIVVVSTFCVPGIVSL